MGHVQLVICPAGSGKVDDYNLVNFLPLDLRKESRNLCVRSEDRDVVDKSAVIDCRIIRYVLAQIDNCIQYCEDVDVKIWEFDSDEE